MFFYKKPLVITDNLVQFKSFIEIIKELNINLAVDFGISPYSNLNSFIELLPDVKVIDLKNSDQVENIIQSYDLIISVHSKQLFPAAMVRAVRCINIHPGYNPINRGWYPQVFAIINKTKIGATIHEIDEKLDHGAIIAREFVQQFEWDTSNTLHDRILKMENKLLKQSLISILNNDYITHLPEAEGELKLKKDFNNLLKLDLNEKKSVRDIINFLRAVTHPPYQNAFFLTENGEKVFVSINLTKAND